MLDTIVGFEHKALARYCSSKVGGREREAIGYIARFSGPNQYT
jgi:hypothetical protein